MKHFLFVLATISYTGGDINQVHVLAHNNPGVAICYTVTEPESVAGHYCLVYNKGSK